MNPYESPGSEPQSDEHADSTGDEPGFLTQLAIHGVLGLGNIALYVFVGVLYWFGGTTAIIAVFAGVPVAVLMTLLLLNRLLAETPEQRREYLREKRRRIRQEDKQASSNRVH